MRRHKIKQESAATSSHLKDEEHDLAHYIHDRVELMHQVFSVIKPKELKAMAPNCVQLISIDNLQELCTEELLGISSKRLCAILDGAEPPTDTESSSSEQLETISLDSISSDEEILSQPAAKKKHKHRKKNKTKNRHKHSSESEEDKGNKEKSKANRAGLTVLELLELQARARAIRAQLQKDNANKVEEQEGEKEHSSDEVEIKEEPPEVFEISSDDEKPKLEELQKLLEKPSSSSEKTVEKRTVTKTITKVVNDLTITVPTKPTHKIKLNRNRSVKTITREVKDGNECVKNNATNAEDTRKVCKDKKETKDKPKKKRKKNKNKDGSDHDEITLQLSDTEKMDLLEDLDRKNFDNFTSSESSDSSSSENGKGKVRIAKLKDAEIVDSSEIITEIAVCGLNKTSDSVNIENNEKESNEEDKEMTQDNAEANMPSEKNNITEDKLESTLTECVTKETTEKDREIVESEENLNTNEQMEDGEIKSNKDLSEGEISDKDTIKESENAIVCKSDDELKTHKKKKKKEKKSKKEKKKQIEDKKSDFRESKDQNFFDENIPKVDVSSKESKQTERTDIVVADENLEADICEVLELTDSDYEVDITVSQEPTADEIKALSAKIDKDLSEGEISDKDTIKESEKAIVCISDDELKTHKKKKKKEKKSKKEKKKQIEDKKSDFRESKDQNFFDENIPKVDVSSKESKQTERTDIVVADENLEADICEVLELTDSDYEVDITVSQEPTADEIKALSAKIDEIDPNAQKDMSEVESWRDRYLGSKKVKKVLTTANLLNALRKKNKELKNKLQEPQIVETEKKVEENDTNIDGTIEQFNTLQGSTTYVDPVVEDKSKGEEVTKEMKKDAKQLLKMYKMLLKYNDINRQKDPNRKKKKKQKKSKEKKDTVEDNLI